MDTAALIQRAEQRATSGDPIPEMAKLISEAFGNDGYRVSGRGLSELERSCSRALARDQWPSEVMVMAEGKTDGPGPQPKDPVVPGSLDSAPAGQLFERTCRFPNKNAERSFASLHGLDALKTRLIKEAVLLTRPQTLETWSTKHHQKPAIRAVEAFRHGTPLLVFAGDVGTGKTALAQSFGDAVAQTIKQPVHLMQMSIKSRGSGIVGEMTQLITNAFRAVQEHALRTHEVTILLLDEADALAESRETAQMHHEDRAGVNALIQGVDLLRGSALPILVVFCTNRLSSLDPAIRRRAADVFEFRRPDVEQRRAFLEALIGDLGVADSVVDELVQLTGPRGGRQYGFTYSDISDRLVRNAVLDAYPDHPLDAGRLRRIAREMVPTRPFIGETDG